MYVITGASGKVGKVITEQLLEAGQKVRVLGRSAENLMEFAEKGADVMVGDVKDAAFVNKAFAGADMVYCMIPPNFQSSDYLSEQKEIGTIYADAVKENNVKNVVLLSSLGAHLQNGAGIVDGLAFVEDTFRKISDINLLILRPSYFMENVLGQIQMIKQMGMMGSPIIANAHFPIVASHDIGMLASKRMLDKDFQGEDIQYILGPKDCCFNHFARSIGFEIGKPDLKYMTVPYDQAKAAMVESGFISENVAELFNGLAKAINEGTALTDHVRTRQNTTATTMEDFAKTFAYLYNNQ
ncbi:MAG: azoB 2 [Ignavibacteria bacterium]|nr:azoB 2 [Ignavibacteria bacterium]